jgi:hypothetical protein
MISCPICNSPSESFFDKQLNIFFYECKNCFLFFKNNFLNEDEEKKRYDLHDNSIDNQGYVNYLKEFINNYILDYIDNYKQTNLLDFGSGSNQVLINIFKKYYSNYQNVNLYSYDKYFDNNENWKNNKYDIIVTTEVLEHLAKPLEELKLLHDLMNKNSYLIIMTNFHNNDKTDFLKWWYRRDPTHLSFFSLNTFEYLADKLDMQIVKKNNKNVIVLKK